KANAGETENRFTQSSRLSFAAWGQKRGLWNSGEVRPVVYDLKAGIEGLLARLQIANFEWQTPKRAPALFHPAQVAILFCEGRALGWLGSLHPLIQSREKLRVGVALAEFDFEKLMRGQPRQVKSRKISVYPAVERDLALVMPEELPASDVMREMRKAV